MKTHPHPRSTRRSTAFILAGSIAALLASHSVQAASQTWDGGSLVNGNWSTTTNWVGDPTAPGSTASTTNADTATFNAAIANTWGSTALNPIVIDLNRNIRSLTFTGATGNYFIGSTGGNALLLSSGGTIQIVGSPTLTATNVIETINAPLVIQGASGTYTFANNSSTGTTTAGTGTLIFGGGITGGAAGNSILFLGGSNDNANTVSGIIANGAATTMTVNLNSSGTWNLTGANTYTGATTVSSSGLLRLSGASGALASTAYSITGGGTFSVDNTTAFGGNNNARIDDSAAIALGGGFFTYLGANAAATNSTEIVGAISTVATSPTTQATITVSFGGTNTATLTAASLTHAAGDRSILVNGASLGRDTASVASTGRFFSTAAPTLVGTTAATATGINAASKNTQIVPFLIGAATATTGGLGSNSSTANTFVTYHATTGFRPLNPTDEFTNNAIAAGNNTRITLATTAVATTTINSLLMAGGDFTITDGQTLTDTSGAILFGVNSAIRPSSSTGALTFGFGAEGMVTVNSGVNATIGAVIADNGGTALTKSGPGNLMLTGLNTYAGKTTFSGGTLSINSLGNVGGGPSALGNPGTVAAGTIDLNGTLLYTGAAASSDRVINLLAGNTVTNNGSGPLTLTGGITGANTFITFNGTADITVTGLIATGTGSLNYSGTGTLTLTNAANSFSGTVSISSGTVSINSIANSGAPSALGQGTTILLGTGGTNATTGKLQFTGAAGGSSNRPFLIQASSSAPNGGIIENTVAGQTLTLSGSIGSNNAITSLPRLEVTGAGDGVLSGVITNATGNLSMIKSGSGTWRFSAVNTYTGATVVNDGVLKAGVASVGSSGAFGFNSAVVMANVAGATLDLNGFSTQIGSLTGGGAAGGNVDLGGVTLTVGGNNTSPAPYAGTLFNGSLAKIGTGALTLSGPNTYAGATTVSAGRLNVTGTLTSTVTVTGATLGGTGSTTGGLTTNAGSVIGLNSAGATPAFTANAVNFAGATTLTFDAAPTLGTNAYTVVNYGTLANLGNLSVPAGYRSPFISDDLISKVFLTITTGTRIWNQAAPGNWNVLTSPNWAGGDSLFAQGDAVVFDDTATNGAVTLVGTLLPGSVTVNNSATPYTLGGAGSISGPAGLTKMNDGLLTLTGANSYTGATAISDGTVNLTGSLTGGTAITVSGTAVLSESATGVISGAASLTHFSSGTSTLAGTNSYTGPTAIGAGTVNLTGSLSGGTAITVSGPGVLSQSSASVISGGTSITFSGSGVNTLAGVNTFYGGVTLNSGTLNIKSSTALGFQSGTFLINGGTIDNTSGAAFGTSSYPLVINGDFTFAGGTGTSHDLALGAGPTTLGNAPGTARTIATNAGILSLFGVIADGTTATGITKAGAGTLVLSGTANTFTGQLTVEAGNLSVPSVNDAGTAGTLGNSGLAVILGKTGGQTGTLQYTSGSSTSSNKDFAMATGGTGAFQLDTGSILTLSGAIGGGGGLTKTGTGTLALTGTNTWSGPTTINAGTLQLGSGATSSITTSPVIFLNNNATLSLVNVTGDGPVNRLGDGIGIFSTGGTLSYGNVASSGATYAETVGPLLLTSGQTNVVLANNMNAGGGNMQTLTLSGLAPMGTATVTFSATTTAPNATTNLIKVSGALQTPAGQIIGPWATASPNSTNQTDYAVYDAASNIVPAAIGATTENSWVAGSNVSLSAATTLTGTRSLNSLRYTGVAANIMALAGNNLETLGILNGGTGTLTISSTGGVVRQQGAAAANLYITTGNNPIIISAPIQDNTGALTLVKSGANTLTLSGTNTFSGGVALNAGVLSLGSPTALGTGTLTIATGTTLTNSPSFFNAYNNAVTINGDFTFSDTTANLGTGAVSLGTTPGTTRTITTSSTAGVFTLGGVISDGATANSLTKSGTGTMILTGANAYTGTTTVTSGTLILAGPNAYAGGTLLTGGSVTARNSLALGSGDVVVTSSISALNYAAMADAPLSISGSLALTSNAIIGGTIGATTSSAQINVMGAASSASFVGALARVNVYGTSFSGGTGTYTLLQGGAGSTLNGATYSLNLVFNNTNFTVGAPTATASAITVPVTSAPALTGAFWTGGLTGATQVWSASNGSTASNWVSDIGGTPSAVVPGAGADVTFSATIVAQAPTASTLGADMTIQSLTQNSTTAMTLNDDGYKLTIAPTVPTAGITLNATMAAVTLNSSVVLGTDQTWRNNSSNALTVNGVISGTSALTRAGTGTGLVVLTGANNYTGDTAITAGTLQISGTGSLGTGVYAGDISISGAGSTLRYSSAVNQTLSGAITGASGALLKDTNPSTLALSGGTANTYTGFTTVTAGTLLLDKSGAAQAIDGGGLTIGAANNTAATAQYTGTSTDMMGTGTVNILGRGVLDFNGKTDAIGNVSIVSTGAATTNPTPITNTAGGGNLTIGTLAITPVAALTTVVNSGTGTLTLGGTVTFAAATTGRAQITGTELALGSATRTFNVALGTGIGFDLTVSSAITGGAGVGVTKSGTGRLQLSGTSTYAGATTVTAGTLEVVAGGSIGSAGGTGTTVGNSGGDNGLLLINGGTVTGNLASYVAVSAGSTGTVTVNSGGTWTNPAQLNIGWGGNGTMNIAGGSVTNVGTGSIGDLPGSIGLVTVTSGTWSGASQLNVGANGTGTLNISGGSVTASIPVIGNNAGSIGTATVSGGSLNATSGLVLSSSGTGVLNLTNSGLVMVGPTGTGTLTMANTGGLGTLNLGTGGTAGTLSAGTVGTGTGTAVVNFNHTGSYTFAPKLTGTLAVNKLASGTTTLTAANTYTGATTVSAGTLKAGVASVANVSGAFGNNSAVTMANVAGAALDITGFNTQIGSLTGGGASGGNVTLGAATLTVGGNHASPAAYAGILSGIGGGLGKIGTGTLTLSGVNTYTGNTTVRAGTLKLDISGSISNSANIIVGDTGSSGTLLDVTTKTGGLTIGLAQTLSGIGQIDGDTLVLGTHAPGNSPGLQTFNGSLAYSFGSMLNWELTSNVSTDTGGVRGAFFDAMDVLSPGALSIAPGVTSNLIFNGVGSAVDFTNAFWTSDHSWLVYADANAPSLPSESIFDTITTTADPNSIALTGSFAWRQTGNDVFLDFTAVPEPTGVIAGLLCLGVATLRRRRRA